MAKTIAPLLPATSELLQRFGERLRLARRRRRLTAKQVAERAGMAPMTLRSLERGGAGVTMGAYLAVMQVLGIEHDLEQMGAADSLGRELQDLRLAARGRTRPRPASPLGSESVQRGRTAGVVESVARRANPGKTASPVPPSHAGSGQWIDNSGFARAKILVDLIDAKAAAPKKGR